MGLLGCIATLDPEISGRPGRKPAFCLQARLNALEQKAVVAEDFFDRDRAFEIINESIELYKKTFPNGG